MGVSHDNEPQRYVSAFGLDGIGDRVSTNTPLSKMKTIDYSQKANWYKLPATTKDVDTFYIYSTVYMGANEGDPDYATLDNAEMLEGVKVEYAIKTSVFDDSTNVFVPYYRQASMMLEGSLWQKTGDMRPSLMGTPYGDITDALDYYFEHCNQGRPFVIAGHSQGSAILGLVLKGYFREHPDRYARMVAAYALGYSITQDDLDASPHLRFATGEADTGVIISWHAEGPKNVELNSPTAALLPNGISINPLNWRRDDTYAPASLNKGSLVIDEQTGTLQIRDIGADAQVCLSRGTVITNAAATPVEEELQVFAGPQSYHQEDYAIYYNNIRDNVAKRIATYMAGR